MTVKSNSIHPLIIGNICVELDQNQSTVWSLCSQGYIIINIVFYTTVLWLWTLTFSPPKPMGFTLSSLATFAPRLIKIHWTIWSLCIHKVISTMSIIVTLTFDLTYKINRVHLLIKGKICVNKFDQNTLFGLMPIIWLLCLQGWVISTFCLMWPWHLTSKFNSVHPLIMVNRSAKFDEDSQNGFVYIVFTKITYDGTQTHTQ